MVTLLLDKANLEVVLSPVERATSLHRENILIDRDAITKVQLTDDAWTWLRGIPEPGIHIPSFLAAGAWKGAGTRDFVMIRRRNPGVVIDLEGQDFDRLVLTTKHGVDLAQALRLDAFEVPTDVIDIAAAAPPTPPRRRRAPKPRLA